MEKDGAMGTTDMEVTSRLEEEAHHKKRHEAAGKGGTRRVAHGH
jgi:hypothetical protein